MKIKSDFLTEKMAQKYADGVKEKFGCVPTLNKASVEYDISYWKENKASDMTEEEVMASTPTYEEMDRSISYVYDHMNYKFDAVREEMGYFMKILQNHMKGHLPNVKSNEQLSKAIKALGLEGEYEVYKPMISVANKKTGEIIVG